MRATVAAVTWPVATTGAAVRGAWPTRSAAILVLDDGDACGLGEAAPLPGFGDDAVARAHLELEQWCVDRTPPRSPSARFAIETAEASLAAARAGTTLAAQWGATRHGAVATAAVVDDPDQAAAAIAAGARALKLKLDGRNDRATVAAIRAVAPGVVLRADANRAWPLAELDARLAALAEFALAFVEEPAPGVGAALARRTAPLAVPIALDESLAAPDRDAWLDAALASGAVAALVLKPTVLGGVTAVRTLAAHAQRHRVATLVSHALEGPIALAAAGALAAAIAPTAIHGLGAHPALTAWGAIGPDPRGLGLDVAALRAAIARLERRP